MGQGLPTVILYALDIIFNKEGVNLTSLFDLRVVVAFATISEQYSKGGNITYSNLQGGNILIVREYYLF